MYHFLPPLTLFVEMFTAVAPSRTTKRWSDSVYLRFSVGKGAVTACLLSGCHCVFAQRLVGAPRESLRCDPEGRPDPRLGPSHERPEALSPIPFCRILFPSACCPFCRAPFEGSGAYSFYRQAAVFIGDSPCSREFGVGISGLVACKPLVPRDPILPTMRVLHCSKSVSAQLFLPPCPVPVLEHPAGSLRRPPTNR